MVLPKRRDSVVVSFPVHRMDLSEQCNLPRNLCFFLRIHITDIQLISEGSRHRNLCSCVKRNFPARLLIRAYGHMRPHCRYREYKGRSLLDRQSFDRVGVVAGPDLRAVEKHACVESCTAAGTVFQKKLRKVLKKLRLHPVQCKNVAVKELSLASRLSLKRSHIRQISVHIPFDIGYRGG